MTDARIQDYDIPQMMGDLILVLPLEQQERRDSGLYIPEEVRARMRVTEGLVVSTGPGAWNEDRSDRHPMTVFMGDWVVFPHFSGHEIEEKIQTENGEREQKFRVLSENDVLFKRPRGGKE